MWETYPKTTLFGTCWELSGSTDSVVILCRILLDSWVNGIVGGEDVIGVYYECVVELLLLGAFCVRGSGFGGGLSDR